jgi:predicted nucleic acid-binding protein
VSGELLLDTGGLVSLIDRRQPAHEACIDALASWRGIAVSTEAVLTEASYLLRDVRGGPAACISTFVDGAGTLLPLTAGMLRRTRSLIERYEDLPMDFADATLVALAEELDASTVMTTDRRDFSIYRIRDRKSFRIIPE